MFDSIKGYFTFTSPADDFSEKLDLTESKGHSGSTFSAVENIFKEQLSSAKKWTSQVYQSIKSSENPAQLIPYSVQNHLKHVDLNSVINKVPLIREFQRSQVEFEAEQRQKHPEILDPGNTSDGSCLPWHPDVSGLSDPSAVEALRLRILALSQHENTFLLAPPLEAQLSPTSELSTEHWKLATLLLREDSKLAEMRYNLVPKKISEDLFWSNYFYRIDLLRQSAHLAAVTGASDQPELSPDAANFIYIEKDSRNFFDESAQKNDTSCEKPRSNSNDKISYKREKSKTLPKGRVEISSSSGQSSAVEDSGVKKSEQEKEKVEELPNVDELLEDELAREVNELVLISTDDPLNEELDRELEEELADLELH